MRNTIETKQRQTENGSDPVVTETWKSQDAALIGNRVEVANMFNHVDGDNLNGARFGINRVSRHEVKIQGRQSDLAVLTDLTGMIESAEHRMSTQIPNPEVRRGIAMGAAREVVANINANR